MSLVDAIREAAGEYVGEIYVIKPGDVLHVIAQRYGVSSDLLADLNALENPNEIRAGDEVYVPPGTCTTEDVAVVQEAVQVMKDNPSQAAELLESVWNFISEWVVKGWESICQYVIDICACAVLKSVFMSVFKVAKRLRCAYIIVRALDLGPKRCAGNLLSNP
jgi:murein DD-endopeptidase MepM/ murein hydrolase activator NlpD